jgi:hypothetical protein
MMNGDLIARLDARRVSTRRSRRRIGIGTVISSVIMVAAVAILGSVVLIWANSSLNVEKTKISDDFAKNSNLLRETFIVEDIWLEGPPLPGDNYVNVTLRNIGDISINIIAVNITAIKSDGTPVGCTGTPSCSVEVVPTNGVIASKETLTIKVDDIDWDHTLSASLDISITTERGSLEEIFWRVK